MLTTVIHSYYLDRIAVKTALYMFCALTLIGNCFRILMAADIRYLYLGQLLVGIGSAFHTNVNLKLVYNWFAQQNVKQSLSVILLVIYIEKGLMTMAPYLFIDEKRQTSDQQRASVAMYLSIIAAGCFISLVVTSICYTEYPPSGFGLIGQEVQMNDTFKSFKAYREEIKRLIKLPNFVQFLIMFSLTIVSLHNISDALNLSIVHFGFRQFDGSLSLFYFYVAGLLGSIFYDMYLLKHGKESIFLRYYLVLG